MKDYFEFISQLKGAIQRKTYEQVVPDAKPPSETVELRVVRHSDVVWVQIGKEGLRLRIGSTGYFEIPKAAQAELWRQIEARMSERG